jgi:hypothetical protein
VYKHPKDPSGPLFCVIVTVHILKNFRNNWLNQKPSNDMKFPDFELSDIIRLASFNAIKELHAKEKNQLLKYCYSLSLKALYPITIEHQNVKLVLQIIAVICYNAKNYIFDILNCKSKFSKKACNILYVSKYSCPFERRILKSSKIFVRQTISLKKQVFLAVFKIGCPKLSFKLDM